jgi:hypothetical protein
MTTPTLLTLATSTLERRPYKGVLLQPNTLQIGAALVEAGCPTWYPGTRKMWDFDIRAIHAREAKSWNQRIEALAVSHGIALDVEPNEKDCWHKLCFALARSHVPGFRFGEFGRDGAANSGRRRVILAEHSTFTFAAMVYIAIVHEGKETSYSIAKSVTSRRRVLHSRRPQSWPPLPRKQSTHWAHGQNIQALPFETAKYYVGQIRSAWSDLKRGHATPFQYQAVQESLRERAKPPSSIIWREVFGFNTVQKS